LHARVRSNLEQLRRAPDAIDRIAIQARLEDAARDAELVIEAAPENLELKRSIFASLDELAPADAILATNTSVIPIREIAAHAKRRERVLGTHWWNPPYLIPLVEVVQAPDTSPMVVQRTL